jgi:hypothetical protein
VEFAVKAYRKRLVALSVISVLAWFPLAAASTASATLVVSGTVPQSISLTASRSINSSSVVESAAKKVHIATLTARSNCDRRFSLSVSSQWRLSGAQDIIPYSLTINNKSFDKDGTFFTNDGTIGYSGTSMAVLISTDPASDRLITTDSYSDTIIFTITAL